MLFQSRAKQEFGTKDLTSGKVAQFIEICGNTYGGEPFWLDSEQHIRTINFAKSVCSETARLTTLDVAITVDGGTRAKWLQEQLDTLFPNLRDWVEYGCAYGTVILKPNGEGVDLFSPNHFMVTADENSAITGAVFESQRFSDDRWYTRLEWHRFLPNGNYAVTNKCYVADKKDADGREIDIDATPWVGLLPEVEMKNVEKPLFGVFRTPAANNLEIGSPLGLPVFGSAMEELRDLDIAYSRNSTEIYDSKRMVLLDSDRVIPGKNTSNTPEGYAEAISSMGLPDYIKAIDGETNGDIYHEINPALQTDVRLTGINALLSQIGFKCGFSNGYFVFNEKTGMITATQVESDDRRTIQTIKDMRDKLQACMDGLIYALDKFADLYDLAPVGEYEVAYDFADITYNEDEDRARWLAYVSQGFVPMWYYLNKFEGMTEDEAKKLIAEAQPAGLMFGGEE